MMNRIIYRLSKYKRERVFNLSTIDFIRTALGLISLLVKIQSVNFTFHMIVMLLKKVMHIVSGKL